MSLANYGEAGLKRWRDLRSDWNEFADTRSLKSAFKLAANLPVVLGTLAVGGIFWKPALLGALVVGGIMGYKDWNTPAQSSSGASPPAPPSPVS